MTDDGTTTGSPTGTEDDGNDLALVLAGGGARAAYQVGALAGIAEHVGADFTFPLVTGVSAGAINAATLASHVGSFGEAVDKLERAWLGLSIDRVFRAGLLPLLFGGMKWAFVLASGGGRSLVKVKGVLDTRPLRKSLALHTNSEGIDANLASGRLRALALSATSYATGRTVTFVHGAEDVPTWRRAGRGSVRTRISEDHVLASSALPLIFPAIAIGDEYFGDGSIRQISPLAPAIHIGARRLLAISVRYRAPGNAQAESAGYPPPAQVMGMLMNAVFLDAMESDAERLERVNRSLIATSTDRPHPEGLQPLELLVLRPSRDLGDLARDLAGHLPHALRYLLRGLGSSTSKSQDMLSYLLFERPYIERLIELGRADALAHWDRIAPLLAPGPTSTAPRLPARH